MNIHISVLLLCIFKLEHAKRYQFFDQGIAINHRGLVVWKRDRNVKATGKRWFKSRRLPRKKRGISDLAKVRAIFPRCEIDSFIL